MFWRSWALELKPQQQKTKKTLKNIPKHKKTKVLEVLGLGLTWAHLFEKTQNIFKNQKNIKKTQKNNKKQKNNKNKKK